MNNNRLATLFGLLALVAAVVFPTLASATPITGELFYTRFSGAPNVKRVNVNFDGTTFTLGTPVPIGTTFGADGIAGNPQNPDLLIVGGQGPRINTISKSTGTATSFPSPVNVFHLEVTDPTTVFGSSIPGGLARHTILPSGAIGPGTAIALSGPDTVMTQLITTPSGFFYTRSGAGGGGTYGTLSFTSPTTATTSRLHGAGGSVGTANLPAAHGGVFDPFTNNVIIMGDGQIAQLDLLGNIVSNRSFGGVQFDQGTVDGQGHLFVASNTGRLLFVDYAASGLVGNLGNFAALPFLDANLDDIAPLVGPGRTVPEPATLLLLGVGLAALGFGWRRKTH